MIKSHKSSAGFSSILKPASKEIISDFVELCETVVRFLHIQTDWNKRVTSKNAQCSSRSGFRIFKISREVRVLKQSQSALFCSVSHMTMLLVPTCMMNVKDQTR